MASFISFEIHKKTIQKTSSFKRNCFHLSQSHIRLRLTGTASTRRTSPSPDSPELCTSNARAALSKVSEIQC